MPQGVEHRASGGDVLAIRHSVRIPLMPQGVEHQAASQLPHTGRVS